MHAHPTNLPTGLPWELSSGACQVQQALVRQQGPLPFSAGRTGWLPWSLRDADARMQHPCLQRQLAQVHAPSQEIHLS